MHWWISFCLTLCSAPKEAINLTMIWLWEGSSLFRIIIWPLTLSHYLRQQYSLTSKCVTVEQWLQVVLNHLNKLTSELWFFESINSKKIQFFERRSHMMVLICSSFNYNAVLEKEHNLNHFNFIFWLEHFFLQPQIILIFPGFHKSMMSRINSRLL